MKKDKYHYIVREALEADGWTIIDDPLTIRLEGYREVFIDISAEKVIEAEKDGEKIAVEVKSFIGISPITNMYEAVGKFQIYRLGLESDNSDYTLFLAIPEATYYSLFVVAFAQELIKRVRLKIIVFDINTKRIVKWIK